MRLLSALSLLLLALKCWAVPSVDQVQRWESAEIRPAALMRLDKTVFLFQRTQSRYETIQNARADGVPAAVLFCLHYREADNSFACSLAQGDPLTHRSIHVPRGRIPDVNPPYTWEQCALDAVYNVDRLQGPWVSIQWGLDKMEFYNGSGYRKQGIASPYLWSGMTIYARGKYVEDGRFDRMAVDGQLGCAAILKRMQARGICFAFLGGPK